MTIEAKLDTTFSKFEGQLTVWGAKLQELMAKANVAGQQAKVDSKKHLDELKVKLDAAQAKLHKAKAAGDGKWDAFKHDMESSWKDLEGAFQKLTH